MKNAGSILLSIVLLIALEACKKDTIVAPEPEPQPPAVVETTNNDSADLQVSFTAMANGKVLKPSSTNYTNTSGDNFSVSKFNYYISNVKLTRDDGTLFYEPESYHIIKHVEGLTSFTVHKVPPGNYKAIEFLIGVDSLRNVSGAQTGALDVSNQMFWEWQSGYIFFKLEGNYVSVGVPNEEGYAIHIGGFKGTDNCLQKCTFNLTGNLIVAKGGVTSKLYFNTVIDEIFKNPKVIGFDSYYAAVGPVMFKSISENYKDMFVVAKVEN